MPKRDFDAHRPLRGDEDLARIFTWREWRKVSASLTLQYDKTLYLLADQPAHRALIHRYLEVAEYPDGRIELWADGATLPYTTYDRLAEIDSRGAAAIPRASTTARLRSWLQGRAYPKSGQRFMIEEATLWQLLDADGKQHGQAVVIPRTRNI